MFPANETLVPKTLGPRYKVHLYDRWKSNVHHAAHR